MHYSVVPLVIGSGIWEVILFGSIFTQTPYEYSKLRCKYKDKKENGKIASRARKHGLSRPRIASALQVFSITHKRIMII